MNTWSSKTDPSGPSGPRFVSVIDFAKLAIHSSYHGIRYFRVCFGARYFIVCLGDSLRILFIEYDHKLKFVYALVINADFIFC